MTTKTNNENQLPKISRCPFCGAETTSTCEDFTGCWVVCENCAAEGPKGAPTKEAAIEAWNSRVATAPKHRPAEIVTKEDCDNIKRKLRRGDIHIEHVLPLHAVPYLITLHGGWGVLGDILRELDAGRLEEIFPCESGEGLTEKLRGTRGLPYELHQIGGWVILGTYSTIGDIKFTEKGDFASYTVHCGVERGFTVWGKTYKQAIAKAINEQRRYFEGEVEKAREARHGA